MNGIPIKIVIDTNIIFMSIYDRKGNAAKIIDLANEGKILLYAPISVREEIFNVLKKEFDWDEQEIEDDIGELPIKWVEKEIYQGAMEKTKVKHKADKPIEALALILNCGILTADKHFDTIKNKLKVDDLLEQLNKNQKSF